MILRLLEVIKSKDIGALEKEIGGSSKVSGFSVIAGSGSSNNTNNSSSSSSSSSTNHDGIYTKTSYRPSRSSVSSWTMPRPMVLPIGWYSMLQW